MLLEWNCVDLYTRVQGVTTHQWVPTSHHTPCRFVRMSSPGGPDDSGVALVNRAGLRRPYGFRTRHVVWDLYCCLLRWLLWEGMCLGWICGFFVTSIQSSFSSLNSQLWNEKGKKSFRILSFGIPRPLTICWTSFSNIPSFSHEVKVQETHKRLPCKYN